MPQVRKNITIIPVANLIKQTHNKDIVLTDKYLSRTPFHTGFWVRTRIDNIIKARAHLAKGVLIDVGCGSKPYKEVFRDYVDQYYGIEYSPESGYRGNRADIAGDASELPFVNESFDTILCTEVLEHVMNPEMVLAEFSRILKPDGVVIITVPFFYPIHDSFDFFRYTDKGIAVIMKRYGLEIEEVRPLSGTGLTIAIMFNIFLFDIGFMWTKWLYPVGLILRPVLWILICLINISGWLLEKALPSKHMAFNHLTIARKPNIAK